MTVFDKVGSRESGLLKVNDLIILGVLYYINTKGKETDKIIDDNGFYFISTLALHIERPSVDKIGEILQWDRKKVRSSSRRLEKMGYLEIFRTADRYNDDVRKRVFLISSENESMLNIYRIKGEDLPLAFRNKKFVNKFVDYGWNCAKEKKACSTDYLKDYTDEEIKQMILDEREHLMERMRQGKRKRQGAWPKNKPKSKDDELLELEASIYYYVRSFL